MKVLTVRNPWAWGIFHGKDIENRDWATKVRGRVGIHASAAMTTKSYLEVRQVFWHNGIVSFPSMPDLLDLNGRILGTVEIVDCVAKSDSRWFMGGFGFILRNPVEFYVPITAKGSLGFWECPDLDKYEIAA